MIKRITQASLLVADQNEARKWYIETLGFELRADDPIPGTDNRWVTVAPPDWGPGGDTTEERQKHMGKCASFVVITDDCRKDYETLSARGVTFVSPPEELPWGISAVFLDPFGLVYNLLEEKYGEEAR